MRYVLGFLGVFALSLMLSVGCSEGGGEGGSGGTAGSGGTGGNGVACVDSVCPCTEAGIRTAIAEGGGPFTFDCDGPTTVVTEAEIIIDNDVTFDGEGNLMVDGNSEHRPFSIPEGVTVELRGFGVTNGYKLLFGGIRNEGTLTLTNSTVSGNTAGDLGGGIFNYDGTLTLTNSTVSGNTGDYGGGIYNSGTVTLTDSTVSQNSATGNGGGIYNSGTLTLTNSTVSENTGDYGGGGIRNYGTVTLTNSTVSGNTGDYGGGIYNSGTVTLTNSTVSGNTAGDLGGGIYHNYGTVTLTNSTVSGNTPSGITNSDTLVLRSSLIDGECFGPTASGGHNIESPGDTCGLIHETDQVDVSADDLNLGPLADNGGSTMTHALLTEPTVSVAIDAIPVEDCVDSDEQRLTEDQRGELRPETGGTRCDVGAFELQP